MTPSTARSLGRLLLAALVCGVFSSVPAIEKSDYLTTLATIEPQILVAILFQAVMAILYVAIVVVTYPIVKMNSPSQAVAYLAFRLTGAAFLFVGIVTLMLLQLLGQQVAQVGANPPAYYESLGMLLRQTRDGLNHVGMVLPWVIGGFFLNLAFLKTRLIPRWLPVWGFLGIALTLIATLLYMLSVVQGVSSPLYLILNVPLAFQEIALAVFLLVRGFRKESSISMTMARG
ncbi:DUF4386 domain-containing protein [Saccharospirillum impatiens]|uniref:DUF4386 domain-containing protein n=1 Tax=Saccharospirillum impatiens TaxID=169438 RepID=UPI00048D3B26|nr:DUF4386 domain-containing protein [Saccharospirillum impatiens]